VTALTLGPSEARQAVLAQRIRWFVAATISYNVVEAIIALTAGAQASSTALIGFGLDSVIEVSSAAAVAWQFAGRDPQAREKTALRVIAFSFFGLAAFVTVDAARSLLGTGQAEHSTVGLVLAAVSLAVMPLLSYGQRRTGRELGSRSAVADSKQTLLCTYLSAVLLVGLGLNSLFGWSWADPIAGLVIAAVAIREGLAAWRGDTCCSPAAALHPTTQAEHGHVCECGPNCADACCNPTTTLTIQPRPES
jgi:divalent metal cation (Fe/Co/Zn/Cd) transporter